MADKKLTISIRGDFGGDNSELTKALGEIQTEIEEVTKSLDAMAPAGTRAMETIGLGAEAQLSRMQRLQNSFQGLTGRIGAGIGAIDNFAKSLAPWNQALELGGKAIRFLDEGLDAAAKKYPEHAKDIEELRSQFSGLKEDVMAAVGVMTVELLKPVRPLELLEQRVEALRKKLGHKSFFGGDNEFGEDFLRGDDEAGSVAGSLGSAFDGFTKSLRGGVDFWDTRGTSFVDEFVEGMKKTADATKKASVEAARWRAELAALKSKEAKEITDALVTELEAEGFGSDIGMGLGDITRPDNAGLDQAFADFRDSTNARNARDYEAFRGRQENAFLKQLGIDNPDEIVNTLGLIQTAVSGFSAGMQASLKALAEGTEGGASIFKKGLGIMVSAIGDFLAAEAAKEFVTAAAMAVTLNPKAALHAVAGGIYSAGAVAAYAAANKLGAGSAGADADRDHRASAGSQGGRGNGGDVNAPGTGQTRGERVVVRERTVIFTDPFFEGSASQRREMSKRAIRRAGGGTGWSDD